MLKRRDTILSVEENNISDIKQWHQQRKEHLKRVNLAFDWIEMNWAGESKEGYTLVKVNGFKSAITFYDFRFNESILHIRPVSNEHNIGNGCGQMLIKTF